MSVAAIAWAWQVPDVTSTQRLTLIALADYADADWSCFPGQERLARQACVSRRQMVRVLAQLEERGLIARQARFRDDGKRSSDRFVLRPGDNMSRVTGDRDHVTPMSQQEPSVEPSGEREAAAPQLSIYDYFEMAWKAWPRSEGKQAAARAFASAAKKMRDGDTVRASAERLAAIVTRYAVAYNATTERAYVPHLSTWLNGERWTDPLPTAKGTMVPSHLVNDRPAAPSAPEIPMTARQPMCPAHPFYPLPCQRCHDEEVERRAGLG